MIMADFLIKRHVSPSDVSYFYPSFETKRLRFRFGTPHSFGKSTIQCLFHGMVLWAAIWVVKNLLTFANNVC